MYQRLQQITIGWCNIVATILHGSDKIWGMTVMFHLARALSYVALSIGTGTYERLPASIALAKRTLHEINLIIGELNDKAGENPPYARMIKPISELLLQAQEEAVTHLLELRRRPDGKVGNRAS